MSEEAINYKKVNQDLNYKKMGLDELNKLPLYLGIIDFKITKTSFKMLNIFNDDASAVKYFWHDSFDLTSLDLWYELSREEGIYIDIGAHTGLYTMTAIKSNKLNNVISIEPYYLNMARLITNLRLNKIEKNVQTFMLAVSNSNSVQKFNLKTAHSYLSKGGKIDKEGEPTKTIKLDSIDFTKTKKRINGIKIDTEGEDLKVLQGSFQLIKKFRPDIIIEVRNENKSDIQKFFEKLDYGLFSVSNLKNEINLNNYIIDRVSNIYCKPS